MRPGEKLYEEKLMAEEGLTKTDNDLIHIGKPIPFDTDEFLHQLENLAVVAYGNDPDIRSYVEEIVPTYHAANCLLIINTTEETVNVCNIWLVKLKPVMT